MTQFLFKKIFVGLVGGFNQIIIIGILLASPTVMADPIQDDLTLVTQERDKLKGDVKNIDIKLDGARKKLQDLIRSQAPLTDIQVQKERILDTQKGKLRLLTSLLTVEEKRAELLVQLQEAEKAAAAVAEKSEAENSGVSTTSAGETPGVKSEGDGANPPPISDEARPVERDLADETMLAMLGRPGSLNEFKETLSKLKTDRSLLKGEVDGLSARITSIQSKLENLSADSDEGQKKQLLAQITDYQERKLKAEELLELVDDKLGALQSQFESFVKSQGRNDYIMPGQKLELTVVEDKSFNGKYIVKPGGYILLPRIGRLNIAGKAREDAENTVKKALESTQLRIATVLLEPASLDDPAEERREMELELLKAKTKYYSGEKSDIGQDVIYLTGAFKKQGPWVIPKGFQPTLLTTLIRSGWVRDDADLANVRVLRMVDGKSVTESIDIQGMMSGTPGVLDIKLSPSDVIIVPEASKKQNQTVYLTGNVKNPGPLTISFEKRVTAYTAILNAGGFSRFANLSKVFILRDTGGEKKERIPVDMSKVKNGKIADPDLRPNDIIVVPESFWGTGN